MENIWKNYRPLLVSACASFIASILLFSFFRQLQQATSGEAVGAVGNIVGGILGASGSALAVYWTINHQRKDELRKVSTGLLFEIIHLSREARTLVEELSGPGQFLPVDLLEPMIFPMIVDRVGILPAPRSTVNFYIRYKLLKNLYGAVFNDYSKGSAFLGGQMLYKKNSLIISSAVRVCHDAKKLLERWHTKNNLDIAARDEELKKIIDFKMAFPKLWGTAGPLNDSP